MLRTHMQLGLGGSRRVLDIGQTWTAVTSGSLGYRALLVGALPRVGMQAPCMLPLQHLIATVVGASLLWATTITLCMHCAGHQTHPADSSCVDAVRGAAACHAEGSAACSEALTQLQCETRVVHGTCMTCLRILGAYGNAAGIHKMIKCCHPISSAGTPSPQCISCHSTSLTKAVCLRQCLKQVGELHPLDAGRWSSAAGFSPGGIMEQLNIHTAGWQLHIPHD